MHKAWKLHAYPWKKGIPGIIVLGTTMIALLAYPRTAKAWCVPTLYNCMCTWVFPCPVSDYSAQVQYALQTAGYAQKVAVSVQTLAMQKNILNAMGVIANLAMEIPDPSVQYNAPMTFAGAAPATTAGAMGSNDPTSVSVYEGSNMALEATYAPGAGDTPQIAYDRQLARNAFNRKNATEALARALQYRAALTRYKTNQSIMETDLESSNDVASDLKANAYIKKQNDALERDIGDIQFVMVQLRNGEVIAHPSTAAVGTSTGMRNASDTTKSTPVPSGGGSYPTMKPNSQSAPYDPTIAKDSNAYGDPEDMIRWQINKESSFNPNAQNKISSAHGLAQIVKGTAANPGYGIPPVNTSDPQASINFCTQYDSILFRKFQDWNKVLHAYGTT